MKKILFTVLTMLTLSASSFSAPIVESIELKGLKRVKEELVYKELLLKVGDEFDDVKLKKSIRNLMNTHLFYKIKPEIEKHDDKVRLKLNFKERYSLIPLPKIRLKSNGSVRAGIEVRDYNFRGRGDRASILFTKWFGKDRDNGERVSASLLLYKFWKNRYNLLIGADYEKTYDNELYQDKVLESVYDFENYRANFGVQKYLDPYKVKSIYVGLAPELSSFDVKKGKEIKDKFQNYLVTSFNYDLTTDRVYYITGYRWGTGIKYAEPIFSDTSTGTLTAYFKNYSHFKREDNLVISISGGTKFGYSGKEFTVSAGIPGYSNERQTGKRYVYTSAKYRTNIINKWLYVAPSIIIGDGFDNLPDDLLVSFGFEIESFWAKLSDGIIKLKVYRGTGRTSETKTLFKVSFRW